MSSSFTRLDTSCALLAGRDLADLARAACSGSLVRIRHGASMRVAKKRSSCKHVTPRRERHAEGAPATSATLADFRLAQRRRGPLAPYAAELARLEQAFEQVAADATELRVAADALQVNPTLVVGELSWRLAACVASDEPHPNGPEQGAEVAMVWREPNTGRACVAPASERELLVLEMARAGITEEQAAAAGGVDPARVATVVDHALRAGFVIGPAPGVRRTSACFPIAEDAPDEMAVAYHFTLQWHLTNACDLRCRHCYDRTNVKALRLDRALRIARDFVGFCRRRRLRGDFCLTGGNPLLYPRFLDLYRAIADTDLTVSFLGNPASRQQMEEIVAIRKPRHFQVSLEGLQEHTDHIRGAGHYQRVMEFLPVLRDLDISSGVMLTLTRDNMDQVVALGEALEGRADSFTFNRLAQVGEGAALAIPSSGEYAELLAAYREAERSSSVLEYKDNLFNLLSHESGEPYTDGCTGFGCGAAFNFIAVLPDGEAHACRKFPSPIGNVLESGIEALYDSPAAQRYRAGSGACRECPIRIYCGGCMAVVHGAGLDPFADLDPHCFMKR